MSDSETDEDLNVSQYDIEDDQNVYGSPVYPRQVPENELALPVQPLHNRTQVSILIARLV
jgi:hypothetical protein